MSPHSRRQLLRTSAVVLPALLAGCGSPRATDRSTPPGTGTATTADCDGHDRYSPVDAVEYDRLAGFSLSVSDRQIEHGATITVEMENASEESKSTGNRDKYTIQRRSRDGWQSIFRIRDRVLINDDAVTHAPGEGFSWELTLTRSGLQHAIRNGHGSLAVCHPIHPGTYRFVFWGVTPDAEREADWEEEYGLGVWFSVGE